jgi:SAM-dependent methyltransferase
VDIGCGPGAQSLEMAPLVGRVEGFDLAPNMIDLAKANAVEDDCPNASFRCSGLAGGRPSTAWAGADNSILVLGIAARPPSQPRNAGKWIAASSRACCMITMWKMRHSVRDQLKSCSTGTNTKARIARSFFALSTCCF